MRDGIYKVRITAPGLTDSGVCLISNGHIAGGNKTHYFTGEFEIRHDRLAGRLTAKRYAPQGAETSSPDRDEFHVTMDGVACGDYAQVTEEIAEQPGRSATVSYQRLCEL